MLSTLSKRQCFFLLFKHFLETEITWNQPIIVHNAFSKIRSYVSCHMKGLKQNKPNLSSIKKQRKL